MPLPMGDKMTLATEKSTAAWCMYGCMYVDICMDLEKCTRKQSVLVLG